MKNRFTSLVGITYPLIQGGMSWCSGWRLAAAVSKAGALGVIGSGSMEADVLRHHIRRLKENTSCPFGVNVPLASSKADENIRVILDEGVSVVITSAGNPAAYVARLHSCGMKVIHVVSSVKQALKAVEAGVDAIVAEGVEAGGHNGREELSTMVLVPLVRRVVTLPLLAAGGIATGRAMLAAMALGADGVQVGSRFVVASESSAHENFKQKVLEADETATFLLRRPAGPVRMLKNEYARQLEETIRHGLREEQLIMMTKGKTRAGMFEGDVVQGELEIGQVAALLQTVQPAAEIIQEMIKEYNEALQELYAAGTL